MRWGRITVTCRICRGQKGSGIWGIAGGPGGQIATPLLHVHEVAVGRTLEEVSCPFPLSWVGRYAPVERPDVLSDIAGRLRDSTRGSSVSTCLAERVRHFRRRQSAPVVIPNVADGP